MLDMMRPSMFKRVLIPSLFCLFLSTFIFAQDSPKKEDPAPKQQAEKAEKPKKPKLEIEDAIKRIFKKIRELDNEAEISMVRCTGFQGHDEDSKDAMIFIVEFNTGDIGLFLAAKAGEDKDQFILVEKKHLEVLEDSAHRCR